MEVTMLWRTKYFQGLVSSLASLPISLFIQISIKLPRNTETPCFPVVKLKRIFWETEVLLCISCFLSILLTKQCLLSVPAQATAALASVDSARALELASPGGVSWDRNSVTVRWHLFWVAQPSYSILQRARNTSSTYSPCSQGICTWIHLPAQFLGLSIRQLSP